MCRRVHVSKMLSGGRGMVPDFPWKPLQRPARTPTSFLIPSRPVVLTKLTGDFGPPPLAFLSVKAPKKIKFSKSDPLCENTQKMDLEYFGRGCGGGGPTGSLKQVRAFLTYSAPWEEDRPRSSFPCRFEKEQGQSPAPPEKTNSKELLSFVQMSPLALWSKKGKLIHAQRDHRQFRAPTPQDLLKFVCVCVCSFFSFPSKIGQKGQQTPKFGKSALP